MIAAGALASVIGPERAQGTFRSRISSPGRGQTCLEKGEIVVSFLLPERPPHIR